VGGLAQRYSVLVFMVIVLRVLERIGILIFGWFAAYCSGFGVHLLVSSGISSTLSSVLVYLLMDFTPFSTAIKYWHSGSCLHSAFIIRFSAPVFHFLVHRSVGGVTDIVVENNMILSSYPLSFRLSIAIAPRWERGSGSQIL
jgi:hypothetical protein